MTSADRADPNGRRLMLIDIETEGAEAGGSDRFAADAMVGYSTRGPLPGFRIPSVTLISRLATVLAAFSAVVAMVLVVVGVSTRAAVGPLIDPSGTVKLQFASDDGDSQLRYKLAGISGRQDTAETKLQDGAAAIMGHWFDPAPKPSQTTRHVPQRPSLLNVNGLVPVHGEGWYRVNINAVVRSGVETDSPQLTVAPAGLFVHISEKRGRRVKVDRAASSLMSSKPVVGWMSMTTGDGKVDIIRPSRQALLTIPGEHASLTENMDFLAKKREMEKQAVTVAKVTASQKRMDDALHQINAGGLAHDISQVSRNPEKFEDKAVETAGKAGEHVEQRVEEGAQKLLGALDHIVPGVEAEGKKFEGEAVGEVKLPEVPPQAIHSLVDALGSAFR